MSRVIWKGSISFGLVHVPVGLYPAERRSNEVSLSLLDRRDMSPVGYKRVNKNTDEEVPWEEIVKAFEYEKGYFVALDDEDLQRANVKATQTVEIVDFVSADEIPLLYYDKPYYLEPLPRGEKGYALLRETLRRSAKVGIAKVVLRSRQHLAALIPQGDMLVLELLRFQYELRDPGEFNVPASDLDALAITDKEIEMAERLVEGMVEPFNPGKYRDEYRDDLLHLVEEKVKAGESRAREEPAAEAVPRGAEVIDLMTLLKKSVEETRKSRGGRTGERGGTRAGGRGRGGKKRA